MKSNKPVLFFSFDESAFQFVGNYIKVYSLTKPRMEMDTNKYTCKAGGFYSLTPEGNDYITFMENSKKETIAKLLKEIWGYSPDDDIETIRVHIRHLRSKIGKISNGKKYIETIYGGGYKLNI